MKPSRAVTALKVLLLILLLSILMAILFPAGSGAPTGRRAAAKNDTVQIATAITGFETEYGELPSKDPAVQDVGGPILQALMGSNSTINPRNIVFLEIRLAEKNRGGLANGTYVDPWGSPYKVKFDTDFDNKLQDVGSRQSRTAEVPKKVAVWVDPDTHADKPNDKTKARRAVTSWN